MSRPTYNGQYAGFLVRFLRESDAAEKLKIMFCKADRRGHHVKADALWEGRCALNWAAGESAARLTERGQLLLAWAGTKAMEGHFA